MLNSWGIKFANISENKVIANNSEFTVHVPIYLWTEKAWAKLRGCTGSPVAWLFAFVISTIFTWAGSYFLYYQVTCICILKCFSAFSVMATTYADSWSDMAKPCDMDLWVIMVMQWRSAWPIFHDPVILPYMLKTIWCMYIILWEYESVWPDVWPQS